MRAKNRKIFLLTLILAAFLTQGSLPNRGFIPLSSGGSGINSDLYSPIFIAGPDSFKVTIDEIEASSEYTAYINFVNTIVDGSSEEIRGLYVSEDFAFHVIQQPSGQAGFISNIDGVVTQFSLPENYGVTGLLAHNYLSGRFFSQLKVGDVVQVVYGDGEISKYQIAEIQDYQALQPNSPSGPFLNLQSGELLSSKQLFDRVYTGSHHLTLQTCIENGSEDSWGRLFIIAYPI